MQALSRALLALAVPAFAPFVAMAESSDLQGARLDWILTCQGCHRSDGSGTPGRVPPIKNHVARFLSVEGGREFLVRVPGVASSPLGDDETTALVNWMLVEFDPDHVPDDFRPYTVEEVADLRKRPLSDVNSLRSALLSGMQDPNY